jgi:aspartyl/asparaginyl-tRNA synthetase
MFNEKALAVIRIRATLLHAARCWLNNNGYLEVHGPMIIPLVEEPRSNKRTPTGSGKLLIPCHIIIEKAPN